MTYYLRSGNAYSITSKDALNLTESLPAGNYAVKYNEQKDFYYIEMVEVFAAPEKIYGDTNKNVSRIINTFLKRAKSTGVLLTGEQGSGKTLLAQLVSIHGNKLGVPTLLVNEEYYGETFNQFLQSIEQPIIVFFDEFEKTYDKDSQERMLTLLDGVYPSKKLFILTCNDKYRINSHMKNRPGRIFYRKDFTGLDQDFIREYCDDNLDDKSHIDTICRLALLFAEFNFDMLKGLIEDMNRYQESPEEVLELLNAKPENSGDADFEVVLEVNGAVLEGDDVYQKTWSGNPLSGEVSIMYKNYEGGKPSTRKRVKVRAKKSTSGEASLDDLLDEVVEPSWNWDYARFNVGDIKGVDDSTGIFRFQNKLGMRLALQREKKETFNWSAV